MTKTGSRSRSPGFLSAVRAVLEFEVSGRSVGPSDREDGYLSASLSVGGLWFGLPFHCLLPLTTTTTSTFGGRMPCLPQADDSHKQHGGLAGSAVHCCSMCFDFGTIVHMQIEPQCHRKVPLLLMPFVEASQDPGTVHKPMIDVTETATSPCQ